MSYPTMTDFVVGNDDCKFTDILRVIISTRVFLTYPHLFTLMIYLQTQDPTKSEVEYLSRQPTPSYECLEKMLIEWRSRKSSRALLSTFIEYVRNCNLNTLADVLQNEFWPGSSSTDTPEEHLLPTVHNVGHTQGPYSPKKRNHTKYFFLFSCILMVLVVVIISLAFFFANLKSQNGKPDSLPSQLVPIAPKSNGSSPHEEMDYFHKFQVEVDESILLADSGNNLAVTESAHFQGQNKTELVITNSKVLNEFFIHRSHYDNLAKLEFSNSLGQICEKDYNEVSSETVSLPEVKELVLDVSKDCEALVDIILSSIRMNYLKILRFKGYITDGHFVQQIHEFLHLYYGSLEEVHINGFLVCIINLFEIRNSVVLNSVKVITVKLDDAYDTSVRTKIINERLCSIFPSLEKFETKKIYISFDELYRLQNCSRLENLNTKIRLNANDVRILEELNWQEKFPSLKYIGVNFQFDECPEPTYFEKLIKKFDAFEKHKLCSNCNMSLTWRTIHCMRKSRPT